MTSSMHTLLLAATSIAAGAAPAAQFVEIGPGSANAVSADGATVVGADGSGGWVWQTTGSGMLSIGEVDAVDVSGDGATVLGEMGSTPKLQAGLWVGVWVPLPGLTGSAGCDANLVNPYALSDDGQVAVGLGWEGCKGRAYRWTPANGAEALPQIGFDSARANAVSGDGQFVGGWDQANNGTRRAAVWKPGDVEELILVSPSNEIGAGEVWGFSTDGTFACGQGAPNAFIWSEAGGVVDIPMLAGSAPSDFGIAFAVSDDGRTAVGTMGSFFGTPFRAFIWTEANGTELLVDYLAARGVSPAVGYELVNAVDMTADGSTIVGNGGSGPFANSAWIVELPFVDLGGGTSGVAGVPFLMGSGTMVPGSANTLSLSDAAPFAPALLGIALSPTPTPIPLFGGTLHASPTDFVIVLSTNGSGALDVPFNWPLGTPSGFPMTAQFGVYDVAAFKQVALSNGLRATTP